MHHVHPVSPSGLRLRRSSNALVLVLACAGTALGLPACDRGDIQEIVGEVRSWPGTPELGGTAIPFEEFQDEVGEQAASEKRVLIKTREAYQSLFGHAPPAGVNLPEDWVIFYAAGTRPTGGFVASVRHLVRLQVANQHSLRAVTRLESPGKGCVVTDALTRPYVLVKFKAQPGTLSIEFLRNDTTRDCGATPNPCAAILCPAPSQCVVLNTFPPQAKCVPVPEDPGTNPCNAVRCAKGTHCELRPVTCVRAPCPPIAECVADGPRCGGIAGIPCAGGGTCEDDPGDSCDPRRGGADCGGICACRVIADCSNGTIWDPSPSVCACLPAKAEKCGSKTCPSGQVCCNASCGICTPPGNACIQIACAAP
jgi:hypothetical protein